MKTDSAMTNIDEPRRPNFSGTWIADLGRSKFLGPSPKALTVLIEQNHDSLRQELQLTRTDGTEERVIFQFRTNAGESEAMLNGKPTRNNCRWNKDELVIQTWVQIRNRELHLRDHWMLSPDGTTLSMEHRDDDLAGQLTILKRQT